MNQLDLDCDSYKDDEIEKLLNLKNPYNQRDILTAKNRLRDQITTNKSLGNEKQREIFFFIDTITQRITNKLIEINYTNNNSDTLLSNSNVIEQGSNFIIENPSKIAGKYSKLSDGRIASGGENAPPGYLNPINVRTLMQAVSIDTRFRPSYYTTKSTNFDMVLPAMIKNVISMRIAAIEIPMTYYAVSRSLGNSTLMIISDASGWLVTLPDGNYEQSWANESGASHLETIMNNSISTAVPVDVNSINGTVVNPGIINTTLLNPLTDICFTIDRTSGRGIFATPKNTTTTKLTNGFTVRFNIDNNGNLDVDTNIQLRLGWQLGFRSAQYICGATSKVGACVSEGICLICGPRYAFLSIDDHQKNTGPAFMVAYGSSIFQDSIITRINLAAEQADVGVYQISSDPGLTTQMNRTREYFGPVDIQRLHIALYDEYGRIIDLNNMDWSFTLAFEQLYN